MEGSVPLSQPNLGSQLDGVKFDQWKKSPFNERLDKLVAEAIEACRIPGLAIAVVDGETTWKKGYGFADARSKKAVEPTTLFAAGSTTKSFTAAAASLLVDDDINHSDITWTTPMCQLIPEDFVLQSAYATTHITLEDCLSHRTGMPSHHADLGGHSVKENTRNLRHLAMSQELRTTWQYSNHMYWAVSRMIEVHCGMELGRFLKEKLWKPLSMDTTFLSIKDAQEYVNQKEGFDMAKPHMWDEEANDFKILPYWDDVGISGAGAVVSNVVDYAKWIRSFITQAGPLSAAGYSAVASPHMIMPPISPRFTGPICYGFGWWISAYHGERVLFHPGGLIGFTASMICLPDKKWGAVGMCNGTSDAALDAPLWHLVDEFLGVPQNERTDVVAQASMRQEMMKSHAKGARDRLFPSARTPPIPPSLPISEYAGSYTHPAYGTIKVSHVEDGLRGCFPGRIPLDPLHLEHVSGEFFLARAEIISLISVRARARFEIDSTGFPVKLGVEFDEGAKDLITWFLRK